MRGKQLETSASTHKPQYIPDFLMRMTNNVFSAVFYLATPYWLYFLFRFLLFLILILLTISYDDDSFIECFIYWNGFVK